MTEPPVSERLLWQPLYAGDGTRSNGSLSPNIIFSHYVTVINRIPDKYPTLGSVTKEIKVKQYLRGSDKDILSLQSLMAVKFK